jgi:hypothetical protein
MAHRLHILSLRIQVAALWAAWFSASTIARHWPPMLLVAIGIGALAIAHAT